MRIAASIFLYCACTIWYILIFLMSLNFFLLFLYGFGEQKSLATYIKNHAYSNAKTEDLWSALEGGSGEPVNKLMSSWTKQKGYPVVSAKIKDGKLELEQVIGLIALAGFPTYTPFKCH